MRYVLYCCERFKFYLGVHRQRSCFFFLNDTAPPEISPLPLHAALPISMVTTRDGVAVAGPGISVEVHAVPFQCSAYPPDSIALPAIVEKLPTAQMSFAPCAEIAVRWPVPPGFAGSGAGSGTKPHWVPSQCSTSGLDRPIVPTAHASVGPRPATPARNPATASGLSADQVRPFQCSVTGLPARYPLAVSLPTAHASVAEEAPTPNSAVFAVTGGSTVLCHVPVQCRASGRALTKLASGGANVAPTVHGSLSFTAAAALSMSLPSGDFGAGTTFQPLAAKAGPAVNASPIVAARAPQPMRNQVFMRSPSVKPVIRTATRRLRRGGSRVRKGSDPLALVETDHPAVGDDRG